jgi:fatty-acyl-CoA synthase
MIGYYNDPEATGATLKGGWLHTGDMGRLDEDGYLYLMDRCKDMIISGGENVYCIEVETVLAQIPEILEAVVVGKPDEKWGEIPKAFVVKAPDADLTEETIITYCRDNLAHFKCPKEVEFIAALPRSAAGKVLKRELRKTD